MGSSEGEKIVVWLQRVLEELDAAQQATEIAQDSSGSVDWEAEHFAEYNRRSKHVDLIHHYVRELIAEELVTIKKLKVSGMIADFWTKPLSELGIQKGIINVNVERFPDRKSLERKVNALTAVRT